MKSLIVKGWCGTAGAEGIRQARAGFSSFAAAAVTQCRSLTRAGARGGICPSHTIARRPRVTARCNVS